MLARERLVVYAQLARIDKPIGTLLLLWPTLWGLWLAGNGQPNIWVVLIFIAGTFLMRSAGCVINDYADRHFDGAVERTKHRPFARGAVSEREALLLAAGLAAIAFLLVLPLNQLTWWMSLPAVVLAGSYPFTKRFFPLPQAYLGIAFGFGIPMAFAALNNEVPLLAWQLLIANVFWTLAYDTEYAMCDKPDDLKIGIKTSAITFGNYDVLAVMVCHVMFLGIMAAIAAQQGLGVWFIASLCAAAVLMMKQYQTIRHRERMACFQAFLDNNKVGFVIFVGLVADFGLR
ncbi:4-hydroxybenzoate octaprenyltransferase [Aquaspirillum serpens]|uniref:4-hydroxybenzoate octaprenyltransferase n=1 Tax=Aquaspirillum serpens TaxID=190 RepID=UPI0003B51564|nr:4-hydroxybenzoate octaprenyltransferase [Aquaspirillum serpens]